GKHYIDFKGTTLSGDSLSLSSLSGKYIYLTFGSANCGACRMENRDLRRNFSRLPTNLKIVHFSLDANRADWEAVTRNDSIHWVNISDGKGNFSEAKQLYNVQAMPAS